MLPLGCFDARISAAGEGIQTPSEKTKEAINKLSQVRPAIGQTLKALRGAMDSPQKAPASGKTAAHAKSQSDGLKIPTKKIEQPEAPRFSGNGKRDPFRPATLKSETVSRPRENLSPLQRFDLGQLKLIGVVWGIEEPRAMIEDSSGLGYVVKIGTAIGVNEGRVTAIRRNEIVVEESYHDFHGSKKKRDVSMRLSAE
jgi:type IV pilus assembly protein PilP